MVRGSISKEESVNMGLFYLLCFVPLQNGRSKKHRRSTFSSLKTTQIYMPYTNHIFVYVKQRMARV